MNMHEVYDMLEPHAEECTCHVEGETLVVSWECLPEDVQDAFQQAADGDESKLNSLGIFPTRRESK